MDYGKIIGDSFEYTKKGLFGNLTTWVLLILLALLPVIPFIPVIAIIISSMLAGNIPDIPLVVALSGLALIVAIAFSAFYQGYLIKIFRGDDPLPEVAGYGALFSDGIKYIAIEIVYFLPVIVFLAITIGSALMAVLAAGMDWNALIPIFATVLLSIGIAIIIALIISLFALIGVVRFARTGAMSEAFNFSAIFETIRGIGWGTYLLALIIGFGIIVIVQIVLGVIPYIGGFIQLLISPFISVFITRYITLIYESGAPSTAVLSDPIAE